MTEPDRGMAGEPDYRFTLANERTFLAWIRTSLALVAGGVAVRELAEPLGVRGARTGLAAAAILAGVLLAVWSLVHWTQVERAMRSGRPLPSALAIPVLALGIAAVGIVSVVLIIVA